MISFVRYPVHAFKIALIMKNEMNRRNLLGLGGYLQLRIENIPLLTI